MTTEPRTNGLTVRAIRRARGLRQDAVAHTAGISKTYLSNIEAGRRTPLRPTAEGLAKALDVDPRIITGHASPIPVLRELAGLGLADLARHAGLSPSALRRIEQGVDQVAPAVAAGLAARLGCDPEALTPVFGSPSGRVA